MEELLSSSLFCPENIAFLDKVFVEESHPLGHFFGRGGKSHACGRRESF